MFLLNSRLLLTFRFRKTDKDLSICVQVNVYDKTFVILMALICVYNEYLSRD